MNRDEKLISPSLSFLWFFFFYWNVVTGYVYLREITPYFKTVPLPVSPTVFEIKRQSSYDFYEFEIFTAYDSNFKRNVLPPSR